MNTLIFDTLRFTQRLKAAGVAPAQAIAEAEALYDALSEAVETSFAPKSDIAGLRSDIVNVRFDIERAVAKIDGRFNQVDGRFGMVYGRFDVADGKIDKLAWTFGMLVALNAANFARQFF